MLTLMSQLDLQTSTSFVDDERSELMMIFANIVYDRGFAETRLAEVADRADISVETVQAHWPTEVDWLLETVAASTRWLFARAAKAYMRVEDDRPLATHRALTTLLTDLAGTPALTHLAVVDLPALGPLVHNRRRRMLDLFATFLALDDPADGPAGRVQGTIDGLWELVRRYALKDRLRDLPDSLPAVSHVCLSTVFGIQEAQRVNRLVLHAYRPVA